MKAVLSGSRNDTFAILAALRNGQAARILNKANFGKSSEELIAQWDRQHPDDPVEE